MIVTKPLNLERLTHELVAAGVSVPGGLGSSGAKPHETGEKQLYTFVDALPAELPPEAVPVVDAHVAPPLVITFVESIAVGEILRTTDDTETDVFVLPAQPKSIYRAHLEMSAIDAGNGAVKFMEGILVWKRLLGTNVLVPPSNITVLSQINDTAAASWIMNGLPSGGSFRLFVKGAPGRTIDWALTGTVGRYAPEGLAGSPSGSADPDGSPVG